MGSGLPPFNWWAGVMIVVWLAATALISYLLPTQYNPSGPPRRDWGAMIMAAAILGGLAFLIYIFCYPLLVAMGDLPEVS